MLGTRSPGSGKLEAWRQEVGVVGQTGTFEETAKFGDIVVLATLGTATEAVLDIAGPSHFAEKLVIDATNPFDFSQEGPPGLFVGLTDSLGERVQRKLPQGKVVKCFNSLPNTVMVDPDLPGGPPDMIICGNDREAKRQVVDILGTFGWPSVFDIGGIEEARWLEAFTSLLVRVALALDDFHYAFKLLRSEETAR
jgi:predicted dinucleotide-binding enzyme